MPQSEPNPLQDQIDAVKKMKEAVNKTAAEHPDVKEGKCTVEEQLQEPGYVLYNQIADSVMATLSQPEITAAFVNIGKAVGEDVSRNLVTIVGMCMATSAHNALVFYDEMLKKEMTVKLTEFAKAIGQTQADVATFGEVLKVYKARLEKVEEEKKIQDAVREAGIDPNTIK